MGSWVAGPATVRALSLSLTPSGMRALRGRDHPPHGSHAVNALKDQTVGSVNETLRPFNNNNNEIVWSVKLKQPGGVRPDSFRGRVGWG
jgi:hypothetical protein